jgi:hypothetical protein
MNVRTALAVVLAVLFAGRVEAQTVSLLPPTAITTAVTGVVTPEIPIGTATSEKVVTYVAVRSTFTYGSGGTTAKFWVQTSLDNGTTWHDIMCFAHTTASQTRVSAVTTYVALTAASITTDGALADNTILNGALGDRIRVKYTTVGTYAATTISLSAVLR